MVFQRFSTLVHSSSWACPERPRRREDKPTYFGGNHSPSRVRAEMPRASFPFDGDGVTGTTRRVASCLGMQMGAKFSLLAGTMDAQSMQGVPPVLQGKVSSDLTDRSRPRQGRVLQGLYGWM